jgi:hypothetical protein
VEVGAISGRAQKTGTAQGSERPAVPDLAGAAGAEPAVPADTPPADRPGLAGYLVRSPGWLRAGVIYLVAGVVMWWHVWTGNPASTMVCDCGDASSFAWFIAWPAYAISHGHSLFFTTAVHSPAGMNLLDNTSVLALGVALAPVTWIFGPVAALNVALTAAPVASALAAYACLRRALGLRWVAAFAGGLLFGFSPFVVRNEAINHLQASFLALVPLIFWCCYELVVTQRGRWVRWGVLLGVLIAVQFFVGPEILTVSALTAGIALLVTAAAALRAGTLRAKFPFALRGFLLAGVVAGVLLAYPVWFAMTGPQHIQGPDWFHAHANGLGLTLLPMAQTVPLQKGWRIAAYLGPLGADQGYLGIPALVVLAAAVFAVRRPLTKLCAALTVVLIWLSLGAVWVPVSQGGEPAGLPLIWRALDGLPVLNKLAPANFTAAAVWFIVIAGSLLLDALLPGGQAAARFPRALTRPAARMATAGVVGAALVVPWLLAWQLPFTTRSVTPSAWVSHAGSHLPAGAVVLFYPFPATYHDRALIWQAESGMKFAIVGGRGIVAGPNGAADHGFTPGTPEGTLSALTTAAVPHYSLKLPPMPDPATISAFRRDIRYWRVTNVVMTPGGRDPAYARQWLTAVLGAQPRAEDGAWVWNDVQSLISLPEPG